MNLRLKLSLSFIFVSVMTTLAVGATAWWMLMRDFRSSIEIQSFAHFSEDVLAYGNTYGSWEQAMRSEPFPRFVARRRQEAQRSGQAMERPAEPWPGQNTDRPDAPRHYAAFRFLLLDAQGTVLLPSGSYRMGERIDAAQLPAGRDIMLTDGQLLHAVPVSDPIFSEQDKAYIALMGRALLVGMAVAAVLASLVGVFIGTRLGASLRALAQALENMRPDGEVPEPLPVRSRDEVGIVSETFNRMSRLLLEAHQALQASNRTIREQAEKLRVQSLCDPLTGLHNRRYFDQFGRQALAGRQSAQSLCVMLADLDHFKRINDGFSHAVGDAVLQRSAKLMRHHMRGSDALARYGGEEFVAMFLDCDLAQARERCEALRLAIASASWEDIAPGLRVSISVGLCDDISLGSLEEMLKQADKMLYQAKAAGRNRVEPQPAPVMTRA